MYAAAHLQTALQLVQSYKGEVPFVHYSKAYFSAHKKHGSKDRKNILQLCYAYYRMGQTLGDWPAERRMLAGLFLCSRAANPLLTALKPEWQDKTVLPLAEKCLLAGFGEHELQCFKWTTAISEGIDPQAFSTAHLQQPDLFIRIRPGYREKVIKVLEEAWIDYELMGGTAVRLPNGCAVEELFALNKEVVVQDLSSQRVGRFFQLLPAELTRKQPFRVWDACAASGGKSIMAQDYFAAMDLTVTDKRTSILHNLATRFKTAGISQYRVFPADLSVHKPELPQQNLIITDVPCTGSGTWSRTPEQLVHFNAATITVLAELQFAIVRNALSALAPGGYLLYITCSVFAAENEQQVARLLQSDSRLELIQQQILAGYEQRADSMFAALLRKKA